MAKKKIIEMPEIGDFIDEASGISLDLELSQKSWLDYLYGIRAELNDHIHMVETEIDNNEDEG